MAAYESPTQESAETADFVTVREAAAILGISQSTLSHWVDVHVIKSYRFGPKRVRLKRVFGWMGETSAGQSGAFLDYCGIISVRC